MCMIFSMNYLLQFTKPLGIIRTDSVLFFLNGSAHWLDDPVVTVYSSLEEHYWIAT